MSNTPYTTAAVIVSVYRDSTALDCILHALTRQSHTGFTTVVSEDGEAPAIAAVAERYRPQLDLLHLTQEDAGFRKNRAMNRAVATAGCDYCIFIDGDCVPHRDFVRNHLRNAAPGHFLSGRRVRLGPLSSAALRNDPAHLLQQWENPLIWLLSARRLIADKTRNYELGFVSDRLNRLMTGHDTPIIGCNFSLPREALERVNGFNELFTSPGVGEDCDLEWRLRATGHRCRNVRLSAVVYHLHHPRGYAITDENREITCAAQRLNTFYCEQGIDQYR